MAQRQTLRERELRTRGASSPWWLFLVVPEKVEVAPARGSDTMVAISPRLRQAVDTATWSLKLVPMLQCDATMMLQAVTVAESKVCCLVEQLEAKEICQLVVAPGRMAHTAVVEDDVKQRTE